MPISKDNARAVPSAERYRLSKQTAEQQRRPGRAAWRSGARRGPDGVGKKGRLKVLSVAYCKGLDAGAAISPQHYQEEGARTAPGLQGHSVFGGVVDSRRHRSN